MIELNSFQLEPCHDDEIWDRFVDKSPCGSFFSRTKFLNASDQFTIERFFVTRNGEKIIGLPVSSCSNWRNKVPFSYYVGPIISPSLFEMPEYRRFNHLRWAIDFSLREMSRRFPFVYFELHPSFVDLRGFGWYGHGSAIANTIHIDMRYSARIDLEAISSRSSLLSAVRKDRRQDLKNALKFELQVVEDVTEDEAIQLYVDTFRRQNLSIDTVVMKQARALCAAAKPESDIRLFGARSPDGALSSVQLCCIDSQAIHAVLAASRTDQRAIGGGTLLAFRLAELGWSLGVRWIDFNGANSPARADFKHSMAAMSVPYAAVVLDTRGSDA
jgi:uncharacterized protein YigA (DUF484 family)